MPRFDGNKKRKRDDDGGKKDPKDELVVPPAWYEERCHVCTSDKWRIMIEQQLARLTPFIEISRLTGGEIDRRSISNHSKEHLNWEDAAIQRIVQEQAEALGENTEEGISSRVIRRTLLELGVRKGYEAILTGDAVMEPKDTLAFLEKLDKVDGASSSAQLDTIKVQFNAFLQVIREINEYDIERITTSDDLQRLIMDRVRGMLEQGEVKRDTPQLEA